MRRRSAGVGGLAGADLAAGRTRSPVGWAAAAGVRYKTQAIAKHLQADPRPFAWADEHLYRRTPPRPVGDLGLEHLLICPRRLTGLTAEHIERLLRFAAQQP